CGVLYRNRGDGTFEDVTAETGAGAREQQIARAGMGIAVGDIDGDGRPDLAVTNFAGEPSTVYHNVEGAFFDDVTDSSGVGPASWPYVQWGTDLVDLDDDGAPDLVANSGHLVPRLLSTMASFFRKKGLNSVIYGIINERRKSVEDTGDLLSMLLMARDEEDGGMMTDVQIRDEALTLFLAGHETTSNALTFTWYLLSQNPEKAAKLHEELDAALVTNSTTEQTSEFGILNSKPAQALRLPTMDDLPNLKYTEAVLAESMRLFPPAWAIGRLATEEHQFGSYVVPKGALVLVSPYVAQRDPRYWENADDFIPERWETQSVKEAGQKNIYFPFGGGVRRCIGEAFAWTEGILLLATLARKWKLELMPEQKIGLQPLITLRPKYGMKMRIVERN
ncbi:MAG: cytochrome P450, partial [Pyrinomonadaceae bacterium]